MKLCWTIAAIALSLSPTTSFAAPDARARDAAEVFSRLCVSVFIGAETTLDKQRFKADRFDEATKKKIKPDIKSKDLWSVQGVASGAMMLVHYEPTGLCVVEVAEAHEKSIQEAVAKLAAESAQQFNGVPTEQPQLKRPVLGLMSTTSSWRFATPKRDVLIMLTTVPEPKLMVQHVLTASYVR